MKKYLLLVVSILMFTTLQQGISQTPSCEGDPCVNLSNCGTWVTPAFPILYTPDPSCPSCTIKVYYKYRDNSACQNICPYAPPFEFQIDFVLSDGSCFYPCGGNPAPFQFGDLDKLYMIGLFAITKHYSTPLLPGQNCGPVIPNVKGVSCKKEYLAPNGNVYILNCEDYECCIQNVQYCNSNGHESLIKTNINVVSDNCDTDPDGLTCEFSCLWEWEDSYVPKLGKLETDIIDADYNLNITTYYDKVNVKLSGLLDGNLNVNIFNSDAKTIINQSFNVEGNVFENDFNSLISGVYYISFDLNGQSIKADKFVIIR